MKKLAVIFCVCSAILVSCSKEKSIEGGVRQKLLVRTVAKISTDSIVYSYGYDAADLLTSYKTDIHFQGLFYQSQVNLTRDGSGVIQQVTVNNNQTQDNLTYTLDYDVVNKQYTAAITTHVIQGQPIKDSMAFNYNSSGKVVKAEQFFDDGVSGGYAEGAKTEYMYDGNGNVIRSTSYSFNPVTGTYEQYEESIFEYDTKVNPLMFGIEAFVINEPERAASANVTKVTTTDTQDPTQNETVTYSYTYNSESKPETASILFKSLGVPFTASYYYQ